MSENKLYEFECPVCEFSHGEHGALAKEWEIHCRLCMIDCGKETLLKRTLAGPEAIEKCNKLNN